MTQEETLDIIKKIIRFIIIFTGILFGTGGTLFGASVFPRLYITNTAGDNISVYNTSDMIQIPGSPFPAGREPIASVINPSANRLYIANSGDNTISVYDTKTMTQIFGSPFPAGNDPMAMALDIEKNFLYIANFSDDNLSVFDTTTMLEIPGSPFLTGSGPTAIVFDHVTKRLYIANNISNNISVYDTSTMTQLSGAPFTVGIRPSSLTVDPVGRRLYVVNSGNNSLTVFDTTFMEQVTGSPFVTGDLPKAIAVDPVGKRLYIANSGSNDVTVYETISMKQISVSPFITGTSPHAITIDPMNKRLYVINTGSNNIAGYDKDSLNPIQTSPVSAGFGPICASMSSQQVVYVDRVNGSDIYGDGTVLNPYKTITKGLRESVYGQVIQIAPGIYNSSIGEVFPIQLKEGVALLGTDAQKTIINGWGDFNSPTSGWVRVGILGADAAVVTGLTIINPQSFNNYYSILEGGIWCQDTSTEIRWNIFRENGVAIVSAGSSSSPDIIENIIIKNGTGIGNTNLSTAYIYGNKVMRNNEGIRVAYSSRPLISKNYLINNSYDAIGVWLAGPTISNNIINRNRVGIFSGYGSYPVVSGNTITMNSHYGIHITESTSIPDIGNGGSSAGGNIIKNNGIADACNETGNTIYAIGNIWDHYPPSFGNSCTGGIDIGNPGSGNIILKY